VVTGTVVMLGSTVVEEVDNEEVEDGAACSPAQPATTNATVAMPAIRDFSAIWGPLFGPPKYAPVDLGVDSAQAVAHFGVFRSQFEVRRGRFHREQPHEVLIAEAAPDQGNDHLVNQGRSGERHVVLPAGF